MSELSKKLKSFSHKHNLWEVYRDFIEITAITISNAIDLKNFEKREADYMEIIKKYEKDEVLKFAELMSELIKELERKPRDVLGELYMSLELGDKWKGQFFTPDSVARIMAEMIFNEAIKEKIKEHGYIIFNEPSVGGGVTAIAFVNTMIEHGYNPQEQLLIICNDLDIKSVYMTYIQLSLLGIPAIVEHRNTLTNELFDTWYTPFYFLKGFMFRDRKNNEIKVDDSGQLNFIN